jgi:(S)-sulfolactate dehydrogenase
MPDIVISEFMDEAAIADLSADWSLVYDPELVDRPEDLAGLGAEARALIVRNRTQVRGALLEAYPALEVVGRLGVGLDNIDLEACRARGIPVCPATGANDTAVAEYVIASLFVLLRGTFGATAEMISGAWPRTRLMGLEVSGRKLGLVGFGAIARETARRANALGMEVVASDPFVPADDPAWRREGVTPMGFDEVLQSADAISLHVPLTEATRYLIDERALGRMRPGTVVINAARGGVVDEAALCDALRAGRLAGAALDVFEKEPLTAEAGARFQGLENLILTPHIAGVTQEANRRVSAVTARNVRRVLEGRSDP